MYQKIPINSQNLVKRAVTLRFVNQKTNISQNQIKSRKNMVSSKLPRKTRPKSITRDFSERFIVLFGGFAAAIFLIILLVIIYVMLNVFVRVF